jgi:hypothetical protein
MPTTRIVFSSQWATTSSAPLLESIRRDWNQAGLDVDVGAELVVADLGVAAHHQMGGAAALAQGPAELATAA